MFYSQFILAKKGPLGTIWIAAHLERKLRKNQVADADIGVSVDSILFPEAPIALRLSSHLLLGVVRIYSRKVNYLFHDCSEALLKIKQAFRSTVVDLPPEESTAPYHSITLPETFDLDDFELPDNAFMHGNFVDHHISTREQITLQDTMDGMAYCTSQFGLDERFGDGDASQIGLELDEDLFPEKCHSAIHATHKLGAEEKVGPQSSGQPVRTFNEMDIGAAETSKNLSELLADECRKMVERDINNPNGADDSALVLGNTTPDLNDIHPHEPVEESCAEADLMDVVFPATESSSTDFMESAQAPSTSVLVEETIPANIQVTAFNILRKTSLTNDVEALLPDSGTNNSQMEPENPDTTGADCTGDLDHDVGCLSPNDKNSETKAHLGLDVEHILRLSSMQNATAKPPASSPAATAALVLPDIGLSQSSPTSVLTEPKDSSPLPGVSSRTTATDEYCTECGRERRRPSQNGALCNGSLSLPSGSENHNDAEDFGAICPGCSFKAHNLEASCKESNTDTDAIAVNSHLTINSQPVSEGNSEVETILCKDNSDLQANKNGDAVEDFEGSSNALPSDADPQVVSAGTAYLDNVHRKAFSEIEHAKILNPVGENTCARSHILQACSSTLENGHSVEIAPDLSFREVPSCAVEAHGREALHAGGTSAEVQGREYQTVVVTERISKTQQILENVQPETDMRAGLSKSDECLHSCTTENTQIETSSELPEPETAVLAPTVFPDMVDDLVLQSTANKENEETADRFQSLSGRKRNSMESTPVLQNGNSAKLSVIPWSKRSVDCIPNDDDVLASILVGRRTALKMRPNPPPLDGTSSKHSRMTHKVNAYKRKVLLDDTMVLHGDAIRQQLTSTEDIRRIRRKAPCTCHEICLIEKFLLEDKIFNEPLFTGMSEELIDVQNYRYCSSITRVSPIHVNNTQPEVLKDLELSTNAEHTKETGLGGMDEGKPVMVDKNDVQAQEPAEPVLEIGNQPCKNATDSLGYDAQMQTQLLGIPAMEVVLQGDGGSDLPNHVAIAEAETPVLASYSGDACNKDLSMEPSSADKGNETGATSQIEGGSSLSPDHSSVIQPTDDRGETNDEALKTHLDEGGAVGDIANGNAVDVAELNGGTPCPPEGASSAKNVSNVEHAAGHVSIDMVPHSLSEKCDDVEKNSDDKNCTVETEKDVAIDSMASMGGVDPSVPDMNLESSGLTIMDIGTENQIMEGVSKGNSDVAADNEVPGDEGTISRAGSSSNPHNAEGPQLASSFPLQLHTNMQNVPSNEREAHSSSCQEVELESAMNVERPALEVTAVGDSCEFGHILDEDTGFLNADDDAEPLEDEDNNMPSSEDDWFLENSGWSSRTRAVAKHLKSLFDNEAGRGRQVVPVDRLLAGKTQKEASRMFFETLVLKTKDYVQVEQENPFENINIKPRGKLMKSEF